ncbi:MAG: DUF389 domain-containing protein [Bacteroidales bacterium]|nr:DUF389 domain-containing protein [Bacteroidales bacterium]
MKFNYQYLKKELSQYFNLMSDKEEEQTVIEQVKGSIVFRGTNLWILMFAILIASLGLNVNSTAVIIGAMLISPLMGPIIGMGLSVGISDLELLKQSLKNYGVATLISVVTATAYFLISPLSEAQSELLARTSPTLYDVLIAFFGGAAGVLALTTKSKGQVIPGVAIATALMPPLCTAGYGLATAQWAYFFGAFYLFFINTVFIATSTFLGVKLLRFHAVHDAGSDALRRGRRVVYSIVLLTMIPAAFLTVNIVKENVLENSKNHFVKAEIEQPGTQILSSQAQGDTLRVVAVGKEITEARIEEARSRLHFYGLEEMELMVIQAENAENLVMASSLSSAEQANAVLSNQVADLQRQLAAIAAYDTLSLNICNEAKPLFPDVHSIAVGKLGGVLTAVVTPQEGKRLEGESVKRLEEWLRIRTHEKRLDIVIRHRSENIEN